MRTLWLVRKLAPLFGLLLSGLAAPAFAGKTRNVVLIVSDGLRDALNGYAGRP